MTRYLLSRLGQAAVVLWIAFTASFILLQALPGDAILIKFMNPDFGLSADQLAEIRQAYGSDVSLPMQYLNSLGSFLTGHLGFSIQAGVPVSEIITSHLPVTLRLAGLAFVFALIVAFGIAYASTFAPFAWLRAVFQSIPSLFISIPVFWLGIMLIQIFSFRLRWVAVINPGEWEAMVLPVIALAAPFAAPLAQILTRNIDAVMTLPFVAVARAKGASWRWVFWRHVLRNAMLPTLALAGVLLGELLAGAVVTETVFGLSGIGIIVVKAVGAQDVAVLQAVVLFTALAFVVVTLLVDLISPVLDPRLRIKVGASA